MTLLAVFMNVRSSWWFMFSELRFPVCVVIDFWYLKFFFTKLPNILQLSGRKYFNNWKFDMWSNLMHENLWRWNYYSKHDRYFKMVCKGALRTECCGQGMVKPSAYPLVKSDKTAKKPGYIWKMLTRINVVDYLSIDADYAPATQFTGANAIPWYVYQLRVHCLYLPC